MKKEKEEEEKENGETNQIDVIIDRGGKGKMIRIESNPVATVADINSTCPFTIIIVYCTTIMKSQSVGL